MSFLAVASQKSLFILQRNQLQYEQTLIMSTANRVTRQMSDYANEANRRAEEEDGTVDLDSDPYYIELQRTEEFLEARQDALDSQINLLDNEINTMGTMVNNNIKSSCTLNLIGG